MGDRLDDVVTWCEEMGPAFLEEVVEHVQDLADALGLDAPAAADFAAKARSALKKVHKDCVPGLSPCVSTPTGLSLRTMSLALSTGSSSGAPDGRQPPEAAAGDRAGLQRRDSKIARAFTLTADVKPTEAGLKRRNSAMECCIPEDQAHDGVEDEDKALEQEPPERTATFSVYGPTSSLFATMSVGDGKLSIAEVSRKDAHSGQRPPQQDGAQSPKGAEGQQEKRRSFFRRSDTLGQGMCGRRDNLVQKVHEGGMTPVSLDEGQTGTVYALEVGGQKIAVFKPEEGENFSRKGIDQGEGSVREEAAYLVDRLCGLVAGVPVTSRACIEVEGTNLKGSVQQFMADVIGFVEDFAMPRDLEAAKAFVAQESVEALALLDMRIFNMDRHTGNLLLLKREKPHRLGPIDHGCCLPPWWALSEANFDAWCEWPQVGAPPAEATRKLAQMFGQPQHLKNTCDMVRGVGLPEAAIITLRVCTLLVSICVGEHGVPCGRVAKLMVRSMWDFSEFSWLEKAVLECAKGAGARCREEFDERGDKKIEIDDQGESLQVEAFFAAIEAAIRAEAAKLAAAGADEATAADADGPKKW